MLEKNLRLEISKGIIQYLVHTASYTLKNIADYIQISIEEMDLIYDGELTPKYSTEMKLLMMYQFILDVGYRDKSSFLETHQTKIR